MSSSQPSRALWLLSGSGLVPLLTCVVIAYGVPERRDTAMAVFLSYSALTLTFLGGARWGAELVRAPDGPSIPRLIAAAMPSLLGLWALLPYTSFRLGFELLLLSSAGQLWWDVQGARRGLLPAWNARLRTVMTLLGTACTAAMLPLVAWQ